MSAIASHAITDSITENRIVHIEEADLDRMAIKDLHIHLLAECDDCADFGNHTEYWGKDDNGRDWRVYVHGVKKGDSSG